MLNREIDEFIFFVRKSFYGSATSGLVTDAEDNFSLDRFEVVKTDRAVPKNSQIIRCQQHHYWLYHLVWVFCVTVILMTVMLVT